MQKTAVHNILELENKRMKRFIYIALVVIVLLASIACGKSEEVIAVERAIDAIGTVTITSIAKI